VGTLCLRAAGASPAEPWAPGRGATSTTWGVSASRDFGQGTSAPYCLRRLALPEPDRLLGSDHLLDGAQLRSHLAHRIEKRPDELQEGVHLGVQADDRTVDLRVQPLHCHIDLGVRAADLRGHLPRGLRHAVVDVLLGRHNDAPCDDTGERPLSLGHARLHFDGPAGSYWDAERLAGRNPGTG